MLDNQDQVAGVATVPAVDGQDILSRKALLFHFSVSQWNYKKKDKRARDKTAADFGVSEKRIRTTKDIADPENFETIEALVNDFRTFIGKYTLPHQNRGTYILPAAFDGKLKEKIRHFSVAFDTETDVIIGKISEIIRQAEIDLNGLFNPADYPSEAELRNKYRFSHTFDIFTDPSNIIVDIVQSEVDSMAADLAGRHGGMVSDCSADCWQRVFDVVKSLRDKMKEDARQTKGGEKAPIFRDTIISNIRDLVDILPGLNISGDVNLEKARQELEKELTDIDPEDLRESKESRTEVAERADAILNNLAGFLGGREDTTAAADTAAGGAV